MSDAFFSEVSTRHHKGYCFPYPALFLVPRSGRRDSFEKPLNSQGSWLSHLKPLFYPTTCFQTSFKRRLYIKQSVLSWVLLESRGRITWRSFWLRNEYNSQETYALGKVKDKILLLTSCPVVAALLVTVLYSSGWRNALLGWFLPGRGMFIDIKPSGWQWPCIVSCNFPCLHFSTYYGLL